MTRRPPSAPLFPYTTLFRSRRLRPTQPGFTPSASASPAGARVRVAGSAGKSREIHPSRLAAASAPAPVVKRAVASGRSEEHTSELQSHSDLVCRLLLEKKKK